MDLWLWLSYDMHDKRVYSEMLSWGPLISPQMSAGGVSSWGSLIFSSDNILQNFLGEKETMKLLL